jgi:hypothetical protein
VLSHERTKRFAVRLLRELGHACRLCDILEQYQGHTTRFGLAQLIGVQCEVSVDIGRGDWLELRVHFRFEQLGDERLLHDAPHVWAVFESALARCLCHHSLANQGLDQRLRLTHVPVRGAAFRREIPDGLLDVT